MGLNTDYANDDAVNSLLDKLIANARPDPSADHADPINCQQDVTFGNSTVHDGVETVNSILTSTGFSPPLPALTDDTSNATTVLAGALSVIVRLSRANTANIKFRQQAESLSNDAHNRIEHLQNKLSAAHQKSEAHATTAAIAQQQCASAMQALRECELRHNTEMLELRVNLQKSSAKERQLMKESKRREGESAKLRQRVHELIKSSHSNKPIMPRVTFASSNIPSRVRAPVPEGGNHKYRSSATQNAEQARNALQEVFAMENKTFRDILRSVQEELDNLLCMCDRTVDKETGYKNAHVARLDETHIANEASQALSTEYGDGEGVGKIQPKLKEGSPWEFVLPSDGIIGAPSEDQMRLPFEVIREEFQDSLEQKFDVIRDILTILQQQNST